MPTQNTKSVMYMYQPTGLFFPERCMPLKICQPQQAKPIPKQLIEIASATQ